ncbi:MAG: hypothetical protein Q9222_001108 [Ikaeria aurantiellina]
MAAKKPSQCFDRESGQVYTERTCKLWFEIRKRVWKVFVSAFAGQLDGNQLYKRVDLFDEVPDLSRCIDHTTSFTYDWVTFLTLSSIHCSRTDLVQISRLVNLGMLTVGVLNDGKLRLDDSTIRAWSRAACEAGAFTKFRILNCKSRCSISGQIFAYLQELPVLSLVVLRDVRDPTGLETHARRYDWTTTEERSIRMAGIWQNMYMGLTTHQPLEQYGDIDGSMLPLLDLVLGSKPPQLGVSLIDVKGPHLFHRGRPWNQKQSAVAKSGPDPVPKKRKLRASRQRNTKDFLAELGV